VNRGKGSQSEFTEIPFADFFAEDTVPYENLEMWQAPEIEGWFDEEINTLNNESGNIEQNEGGSIEQSQPESEVRGIGLLTTSAFVGFALVIFCAYYILPKSPNNYLLGLF
jgi:hypothetical protein